jgi:hypothetical protein
MLIAALSVACLVHLLIEKPITKFLQVRSERALDSTRSSVSRFLLRRA